MAPEGMVHALEIVHNLLKPGGCLVDIHPSGEHPPIQAWTGGQSHSLGYLLETDDFIEYHQASQALEQAITRNLFTQEEQRTFRFPILAGSLDEMVGFLAENWKDAVLPDEVGARAARLSRSTGPVEAIQITERVLIARLRKISHS